MVYTQLVTFESDDHNTAYAETLGEEDKQINAGFDFVRCDDQEQVAVYRKRKYRKAKVLAEVISAGSKTEASGDVSRKFPFFPLHINLFQEIEG